VGQGGWGWVSKEFPILGLSAERLRRLRPRARWVTVMNGIQFIPGTKLYVATRARARTPTLRRFVPRWSQTLKWDAAKLKGGISAFILYPHAELGTLFTCLLAAASPHFYGARRNNEPPRERERERERERDRERERERANWNAPWVLPDAECTMKLRQTLVSDEERWRRERRRVIFLQEKGSSRLREQVIS